MTLGWACCGIALLLMLDTAQARVAVQPRCAHSVKVADEEAELEAANRKAADELPAYARKDDFADAAPAYARVAPPALVSAAIGKPFGGAAAVAPEPPMRELSTGRVRNTVQLQVHTDWRARVLQEGKSPATPKSLAASPVRASQRKMTKDAWGSKNAFTRAAETTTPKRYDRRASSAGRA